MQNNLTILWERLKELEKKRDDILSQSKENILNVLLKADVHTKAKNNLFYINQEIIKVELEIALLSSQDTTWLFWNILKQLWIPLEETEACIVSAEKNNTQSSSHSSSLRVRNKNLVNRTSLLSEILADLGLLCSDTIQIAQSSQKKAKEDNYYFIYLPLLDKTILVNDYQEQATYICKGNYIEKNNSIDKDYLWKNEIRIKFNESVKWKEDILYLLLPIEDYIHAPQFSSLIQVRDRWYSSVRINIWNLFEDTEIKTWSWREFLQWQSLGQVFNKAFSSLNSYKIFAQSWNNNEDKPFEIPKTFKDMRAFFIHCKTDDARTLVEHGKRFKELILESKRLWRKLSLQEAQAYVKWLWDKTKSIIYDMFEDNETKNWAWREEFLEWKSVKEAFEEAFSSSQRYKKFAQSRNMQWDKPHELPETFKQMWSLFIDCTPDQSRKFVTNGLQFKWLILKSKELWRKLSLQEAEEYCNTFIEDRLQVQSDTRKLLWELINDDTTHSIKGNDNTELFQWTFQDAFKDIKTYKLFSERWNNDSTHTIKLPTTRMLFYSLYIWWWTKNERNNLPKSPINMRSLIVSPDELASKNGNKRTLKEAQQQMRNHRERTQ